MLPNSNKSHFFKYININYLKSCSNLKTTKSTSAVSINSVLSKGGTKETELT